MTVSVRRSPVGDEVSEIRVVTLEEHFSTPEFLRATAQYTPAVATSPTLESRLLDLDDGRIGSMDDGGVDLQILSLAATGQERLAPADATSLVHDANDAAFEATKRHPGRFGLFASLALKDAEAAASELERGVNDLGCVGGFLNGTEGGDFLDNPRFEPVFETAQRLGVPLYLHPSPPPPAVQTAYFSNLPEKSAYFLSTAGYGWHAELGMHTLRLIVAGVFDRFPALKIIIGHMGEELPFSVMRAQDGLSRAVTGLDRTVSEYFFDNFVITTSGYFTQPPLRTAVDVMGVDRVLYSVDYPYRANTAGTALLQGASMAVSDLQKVASGNAERVLKLPAAP